MSDKELSRINIIQSVVEKRMRRRDAAHQLALTERQTQRLMNRFRESGAAGLANLRRGRPGNHRLPESLKLRVLSLLHDHYSDFGPTLAAEKLRERHNITVSVETLRKWMTADGLWVPYSRRRPRVHQPRYRRDCLGELVQIDGSPHDWFEGRAPKCCLLVFIDDATGRLMHLRFGETESAFDYMMATRAYLEQHGKPLAFYSDKHGIFRVNNGGTTTTGITQFGRVLSELGIELICANSPQAKGRVERANQTLQDRLIKEMRLEGISSIEDANAWLDSFIIDFNRRFARPAKYPKDLHRPVLESSEDLDDIFAWQESRKLSKTLTFRYDKMIYLVEPTEENTRIAGEKITVYDYPNGTLAFKYGYRSLNYQVFDKLECIDQGQIVDNKRLGAVL
ncbi:TPA: ISNCY family transposase, partial [Klebsiella pneumoniae]